MMPLFIANFGSTLDELGEPLDPDEESSILSSVESFVIIFAIIGAVAGAAGFTMVSLWSISGERQVCGMGRDGFMGRNWAMYGMRCGIDGWEELLDGLWDGRMRRG